MSVARPGARTAERNTVPFATGPPVTFSARVIRGLYRGSFRWSAAKSNTVSAGRAMMISPSMRVMAHLRRLNAVSAQPGREGLGALAQFGQERLVHGPFHDGGQGRHDGGELGEVLTGSSMVILENGRARFTLVSGVTMAGARRVRRAVPALSCPAISLISHQRMSQGSGMLSRLSVLPGRCRPCRAGTAGTGR
jgi:hypothetical protein